MYTHDDQWIITAADASARLLEINGIRGILDVLPKPDENMVDSQVELPKETQGELFDTCLKVLANPNQTIYLHYNIADNLVSRSVLAASDLLPGIWVSLVGSADPYQISIRSEPELYFLMGDVLSVNNLLGSNEIGNHISTEAVLILMAILDHIKRAWMISALNHSEPITMFNLEDIRERLLDSENEDFRWTLLFAEKHLPFPIKEMGLIDNLEPVFLELVRTGLIEPVNEEATIFDLTKIGEFLAEVDRQAASQLILSHSYVLEGEEGTAYDIFTFTRGTFDLLLYTLSGARASFVTIQPEELNIILRRIFAMPYETEDGEETAAGDEMETEYEIEAGAGAEAEGKAVSEDVTETGNKVEAEGELYCPNCKTKITDKDMFCRNCGLKLK